ncbi:MAG TPA: diguanylate cyclase [Acidimicrobiales bacterium]|nr:diguanylate cyclase [Acidimicrobiales bacterium]
MVDERRLFERLADCSPSLTLIIDAGGTINLVRGNTEAFSGYSAEELLGTNILDHLDPDWDPVAYDSVGAALAGHGLRRPMLFRIRRKDGSLSVVEVTANTQLDDPDIAGLACYIRRWDERWLLDQILDAIAGASTLEETLGLLVQVMGAETLDADGVVLYDSVNGWFTNSAAAHGLGPLLAGRVSLEGTPWAVATQTGAPSMVRVTDLPPVLRGPAQEAGYARCWAYPVNTEGGAAACLVLWRRTDDDVDHTGGLAVARLVRLTELLLTREQSAARLRYAANHDPLTGLANRARFFDDLRSANDPERGPLVGVLYLDLDGFKPVNDRYGHAAGDEVLREVARRLESVVRATDVVARLGGDEFAVLCPGLTDPDILARLAGRMVEAVHRPIPIKGGHEVELAVSVGVAVAPPSKRSIEALLEAADGALYAVKQDGAGGWRLAADRP